MNKLAKAYYGWRLRKTERRIEKYEEYLTEVMAQYNKIPQPTFSLDLVGEQFSLFNRAIIVSKLNNLRTRRSKLIKAIQQ